MVHGGMATQRDGRPRPPTRQRFPWSSSRTSSKGWGSGSQKRLWDAGAGVGAAAEGLPRHAGVHSGVLIPAPMGCGIT